MPGAPINGGVQPPLQASGEIAMSDINNQFQLAWNAQIQLRLAETGYYAGINTNSTYRPSGAAPASLSEWYRYHHGASPTYTYVTITASYYNASAYGANINVVFATAPTQSIYVTIRVYWNGGASSSVHAGTIPAGYASFLIECNAPGFEDTYSSVIVTGASPNPAGSIQYQW